jgi:pimeloyl-ACP methyl ester carboxylesterase
MTEMSADPVQHRYSSQGLDLAYVESGDCADPLVILVHGSRDHFRSGHWISAAFVAMGRRVAAPDLRGHGDSQWSPDSAYLTSYQVMDLADLIDGLEVPRFVLVGHSFGALSALVTPRCFPKG